MTRTKRTLYTYEEEDVRVALEEALLENTNAGCAVREAKTLYQTGKRQGEYKLEDYYALPDDRRVELIDGVIYDMASPTSIHQLVAGELNTIFTNYIRKKKGQCISVIAPLDVQIDCDDKTILQPDVLIVCDREKFKKSVVYGAPDLVIEVLSLSTRRKDLTIKLSKYASAGVREYWIVDPQRKKVMVYEFEEDMRMTIYGFEHEVPVGIFAGDCKVNFEEIYEYVKFLYNE